MYILLPGIFAATAYFMCYYVYYCLANHGLIPCVFIYILLPVIMAAIAYLIRYEIYTIAWHIDCYCLVNSQTPDLFHTFLCVLIFYLFLLIVYLVSLLSYYTAVS